MEWIKKVWFKKFWEQHGDRIIFSAMALGLSGALLLLGLHEQAQTIIIGIAMLYFNKARGGNGKS
jgi:hypothetical protein